jgi:nucleotide-binding universal stress UspA family protein
MQTRYKKVLAPVDRNDSYARGVREAIWVAKANHAELCFMHAYNGAASGVYGSQRQVPTQWLESMKFRGRELLQKSERLASMRGVGSQQALIDCSGVQTALAIVEHSKQWGADLIVMGSRGPYGSEEEDLGDTALDLLRISAVPVLLVPGFEQPAVREPTRVHALQGMLS